MTSRATVLAATGLGLAAGFLGGTLSSSRPDPAPVREPEVAELRQRVEVLESTGPGPASSGSELAAMSERLSVQDRRIRALEAELAAAMERAGSGATPAAPERDKERRRLESLKTAQLLIEISRLSRHARKTQARTDAKAALKACEVALARSLDVEQRADVLLSRGQCQGLLGDHRSEDASFRAALYLAGLSTRQGWQAVHELAYTEVRRKDPRRAADWYLLVADQPDAPAETRAWYRYGAGNFLVAAGDSALARIHYRAVIDEFADFDHEGVKKIVGFCRKELEKLGRSERGR